MPAKRTQKDVFSRIQELHPKIEISGTYKNTYTPIVVSTKYGRCLVTPKDLLRGRSPTIQSAVDKTAYWVSMAKELHGSYYDYSKVSYINNRTKITITCPVHGDFEQTPDCHLRLRGCPKCKRVGSYNHTNAERHKIEWENTPAIVYVVKCWNDSEKFYKIGITTNTVRRRFREISTLYNYEVQDEIHLSLYDAVILEKWLHNRYSSTSYTPLQSFGGDTECFIEIGEKSEEKIEKDATQEAS